MIWRWECWPLGFCFRWMDALLQETALPFSSLTFISEGSSLEEKTKKNPVWSPALLPGYLKDILRILTGKKSYVKQDVCQEISVNSEISLQKWVTKIQYFGFGGNGTPLRFHGTLQLNTLKCYGLMYVVMYNYISLCILQAKKRQVFLEETYGGSMRELELLLENFQISEQKPKKQSSKSLR